MQTNTIEHLLTMWAKASKSWKAVAGFDGAVHRKFLEREGRDGILFGPSARDTTKQDDHDVETVAAVMTYFQVIVLRLQFTEEELEKANEAITRLQAFIGVQANDIERLANRLRAARAILADTMPAAADLALARIPAGDEEKKSDG